MLKRRAYIGTNEVKAEPKWGTLRVGTGSLQKQPSPFSAQPAVARKVFSPGSTLLLNWGLPGPARPGPQLKQGISVHSAHGPVSDHQE